MKTFDHCAAAYIKAQRALALARLACRYSVTQRELVERIVLAEDERVLATIPSDSAERDTYFARQPLRPNAAGSVHVAKQED